MNILDAGARRASWLCAALIWACACGGDDSSGSETKAETAVTSCSDSSACSDGKVCAAGVCTAPRGLGLAVDPAARGCEVVLEDVGSAQVASVEFGSQAKGSFLKRAPRTSVSFVAASDASLPGGAARVLVTGDGQPKIAESECIGADGKKLKSASVSFNN